MPNLVMIDLEGAALLQREVERLLHPNVGAVILFARNFQNRVQLQQLIHDIRSLRGDLFIAVDHEGGYVQRFQRHGFRAIPAACVYGLTYDINPEAGLHLARLYGELMAKDLLACGVDLSLAPVLDLQGASEVMGKLDRSFHADPLIAACLAGAFIDGMKAAGMPCVGKHFPGHGSIVSDSHVTMPVCDFSREKLYAHDLKPFIELIENNKLDAVMPAHVVYSSVDPGQPAGFSSRWLEDILRVELGFEGLVISDCLGMAGADIGDMNTRAERALAAGCDMLIVCNQTPEVMKSLLDSIPLNASPLSEKRLHDFKQKMARFGGFKRVDEAFLVVDDVKISHSMFNNTRSV
jgi:beta-N-acetylhexosaminidase